MIVTAKFKLLEIVFLLLLATAFNLFFELNDANACQQSSPCITQQFELYKGCRQQVLDDYGNCINRTCHGDIICIAATCSPPLANGLNSCDSAYSNAAKVCCAAEIVPVVFNILQEQ